MEKNARSLSFPQGNVRLEDRFPLLQTSDLIFAAADPRSLIDDPEG